MSESSSLKPLIFYDIPSKVGPWSPNTWKTRFVLNIKGLRYTTVWVEFPDIAALGTKIGAQPTGPWVKGDGPPTYTLPILEDPNTGRLISDSFTIAEYLDETYPGDPNVTLFPDGMKPLFAAFESVVMTSIRGLLLPQLPAVYQILNPRSQAFFRETREARFGKKLEAFSPVGPQRDADLAKGKEGFNALDKWLAMNDKQHKKFMISDTVTYADCILAAWLLWFKLTETDGIWNTVGMWHNGRWANFVDNVDYPPSSCIGSYLWSDSEEGIDSEDKVKL